MIYALVVFFIAAMFSALFSGYETAFVSSNPIRLRYMAEEEGNRRAGILMRYKDRPQLMLTVILLGTNISNVTATIAIASALTQNPDDTRLADIITIAFVTPLILIFGEIVPKSVFRKHPNRLSVGVLPVIQVLGIFLLPLAWPLAAMTRIVGGRQDQSESVSAVMSTVDDVRGLVDESAAHGTIDPEEREMIHSVIDLQETPAKAIMVPRIDLEALPRTSTRDELIERFVSTGRSRIPIYGETVDEITGVVNVRDVLVDTDHENQDIGRFVHDVMHVPDTMKVDDLLKDMKTTKSHIAIVTDEYGGTAGVITLEDILEEIFGEIQDEHDREEQPITNIGEHAYSVDARMPLNEAAEFMGVGIEDTDVDSVGGWVMRAAGRIPEAGDVVEHDRFRITIVDAGPNYVSKVRIDVQEKGEADPNGA